MLKHAVNSYVYKSQKLTALLNDKSVTDSTRLKYISDINSIQNSKPDIIQMTVVHDALNKRLQKLQMSYRASHIISHFMKISSRNKVDSKDTIIDSATEPFIGESVPRIDPDYTPVGIPIAQVCTIT